MANRSKLARSVPRAPSQLADVAAAVRGSWDAARDRVGGTWVRERRGRRAPVLGLRVLHGLIFPGKPANSHRPSMVGGVDSNSESL